LRGTHWSISLAAIINANNDDYIRRFKMEKDPPFAHSQTEYTWTVFERLTSP